MIFRTVDPIEQYRKRAQRNELDMLSGRRGRRTEFINRDILAAIEVKDGASVLDVGCGNGALLLAMADRIGHGVGTVPTDEERILLEQQNHPGKLAFRTCLSAALPFEDGAFDLAILNGVMLLLRDLEEAAATISELARVTRPGGTVWIGEALVEPPVMRSRFMQALLHLNKLVQGKRIPVMRPLLVTPADWIRKRTAESGLRIVLEKPHAVLDDQGVPLPPNHTRRNFKLTK